MLSQEACDHQIVLLPFHVMKKVRYISYFLPAYLNTDTTQFVYLPAVT